ncbi:MAG: uracil-DNA glycosylase [Alphaproteobacteria bacterium]|nr:uracil-DNA glycosylase [Alphaproteobacteria bacterium]
MNGAPGSLAEPRSDCPLCPRLVAFRAESARANPGWFNGAVPSFGDREGRLLVVGLAPGLKGANRTGRPFTGDVAGELLYGTLAAHGFARGTYAARPDDGFTLTDAMITNAVRCVPPANKPTPEEAATCRRFLSARLAALPRLRVILALGRIAHESVLRALDMPVREAPFAHGARHELGRRVLYDSYHCSRYNTQTGRLTPAMFDAVFTAIRAELDAA